MTQQLLDHPKVAEPDHAVLDLIKNRWSPRAFADRDVPDEALREVLEAARWAPSSRNEQPWRFIVATRENPEAFERLLGCLNEKNRVWAKHAPVLLLTVAKRHFSRTGQPNRHAWHDVGLAVGNMTAQATALDLYVHQIAGILPDEARATFGIPDAYEPVTGMAIGYLGEPAQAPEEKREAETKPRSRRPLAESVYGTTWGEAADLVT